MYKKPGMQCDINIHTKIDRDIKCLLSSRRCCKFRRMYHSPNLLIKNQKFWNVNNTHFIKSQQKYLSPKNWGTLSKIRSGHIEINYYYYIKYNETTLNIHCNHCHKLNNLIHILIHCNNYKKFIKKRDQNIQKIKMIHY